MTAQVKRYVSHAFRRRNRNAFRNVSQQCDRRVLHRRMANRFLHARVGYVAHLRNRLRFGGNRNRICREQQCSEQRRKRENNGRRY